MSTRSAGTARPPVTRPRLSQLTLEGAVGLSSTMLLAWLLLWFVNKAPTSTPVIALRDSGSIADGAIPYLEADRLEIAGPKAKLAADDDADRAVRAPGGSAVVISIAGPRVGDSRLIVERVKKIASTATRNVLILLDQAQVDVDAELGVFGNAPYLGLEAALKGIKPGDPRANVFVLCSAAPGQKSWMIDGQGRSAFSYFAQMGLAGEASANPDQGRKAGVTLDDLDRFVRRNVQGWVDKHRRDATQTPVLLAVGESKSFKLPPIKLALPGQAPADPGPAPDPKAAAPAEDPGKALRADLMKRWQEHEALSAETPAPYRFAPATWRAYETAMLRAERLVRSASNDPTLQADARRTLDRAGDLKGPVEESIKQARSNEDRFPIRPASRDRAGRLALIDSVRAVSGQVLDVPVDDVAARPGDSTAAPASGARKEAGVAETKPDVAPRELEEAERLGRPREYLELQLPAWAFAFHEEFRFKSFQDNARASLFKDAVLKRMQAEEAIALDRRGLDWIKAEIARGDESRRIAQDGLFGPLDDESTARIKGQVADFDAAYTAAATAAERYHDARSLFEKIAAELPYLGEWAVLDADRQAGDSASTGPIKLPDRLESLLQAAAKLGVATSRAGDLEPLRSARDEARAALELLEGDYRKRYKSLNLGARWRDIDDVLVTPLISPKDRQGLIEQVTNPGIDGPAPSPASPDEASKDAASPPVDPGFRRRSAGLALLDYRLRALSAGPDGSIEEPSSPLRKARDEVAKATPADLEAALAPFAAYTGQVELIRKDTDESPEPAEEKLAAALLQADQDVRFRRAAEQAGDQPSIDLESYARRGSILFQVDRLRLDNARSVQELWAEASTIKLSRKLKAAPRPGQPAVLSMEVGPGELTINKDTHANTFKVVLKGDSAGRAFVGVVPDAAPLTLSLVDPATKPADGRRPGGLVALARDGSAPMTFRVEQTASADTENPTARVAVKGFYRGQVVEDEPKTTVNVGLVPFGESVTIAISRDLPRLEDKYGKQNMAEVPDQFAEHQFKGYLHDKGRLDYVLTFQNTTREPLKDLVIKRTLKPAGAEGTATELMEIPIERIEAKGKVEKSFPIEAAQLEKPMNLVVKVIDPKKKEPLAQKTIEFHAQRAPFSQYLTVQASKRFDKFKDSEKLVNCLVIRVSRAETDPVTEPILYRDIKFSVDNTTPSNSLTEGKFLDRGRSVEAIFKILDTDTEINYKVFVEESEYSNKYRVR